MTMTAVIVDDERLARTHLRRLLEAQDVEIIGEAENAVQALQMAEDLHPDLLFLDIQMRGLTGMQAASAFLDIEDAPLLVFVTGYSEYAVAAFEHDALDYLVKPAVPDRLARTLGRARERLADKQMRQETRKAVLRHAGEMPPLRYLPVRKDYTVRLIRIGEIICATARDKRVFVQTQEGEHRTYYTLTLLESLLPAEQFLRIHDSCLINLDMIQEVIFLGSDSHLVQMIGGSQLPVGRTRYAELQQRLGMSVLPSSRDSKR